MDDFTCVFVSGSLGVIAVAKSLLQAENIEYFTKNGYCFVCNKRVSRCVCPHQQQ